MPLLSIIIPVYNAEKDIKHCLNKILQIKLDKEIIVINDASTDKSLDILNEYKDRIILINLNENYGVSHARNLGIKTAKGDFIAFIDIDDDFELDMHSQMIDKIVKDKSDICLCDNDVIELNGNKLISKYTVSFGEIDQNQVIRYYLTDRIFPAVWASIYKTSFAKQILFDESLKIGEDILFALRYFIKAKKTSFIPKPLYHYVQHRNSALHNISDKMLEYIKVPNSLAKSELKLLNTMYKEEFEYFKLEMIQRAVHAISFSSKSNKKEAIKLLKKCITKKDCMKIIKNKYTYCYAKLEFLLYKVFGVRFHVYMFPLYIFCRNVLRR